MLNQTSSLWRFLGAHFKSDSNGNLVEAGSHWFCISGISSIRALICCLDMRNPNESALRLRLAVEYHQFLENMKSHQNYPLFRS